MHSTSTRWQGMTACCRGPALAGLSCCLGRPAAGPPCRRVTEGAVVEQVLEGLGRSVLSTGKLRRRGRSMYSRGHREGTGVSPQEWADCASE